MLNIVNKVLTTAKSQIGYKETGKNNTKYAKYFDTTAWQFFNTKKQGAEWCSIFVHWCLCQNIAPDKVRKILGEPAAKNNCAAGVKYFYEYMKSKKLIVKTPQAGDVIFLNSFGHVGIVESVDDKIHTIEGNKGDAVKRCTYTKSSSKISAYGRPDYKSVEIKAETPAPAKVASPVPAASFNKIFNKEYHTTKAVPLLNLRKPSQTICEVPAGAAVRCYGFFTSSFLYVVYKGKEGYVNVNYLR